MNALKLLVPAGLILGFLACSPRQSSTLRNGEPNMVPTGSKPAPPPPPDNPEQAWNRANSGISNLPETQSTEDSTDKMHETVGASMPSNRSGLHMQGGSVAKTTSTSATTNTDVNRARAGDY
ncbi:MAG: hypothetical protein ACXVB9_07415 [Bdellovibrionota bacterium]